MESKDSSKAVDQPAPRVAVKSVAKKRLKTPTIYDVAEKAGVSKSLVSLVLSGSEGVSQAKRKAVLLAIEKLGYRPSRSAQSLAGGRTKTIGAIITDYKNLSYIGFLRGLREVADEAGFQVTISDLHNSPHFSDHAVSALLSMNVDGVIVAAEVPEDQQRIIGVPFVTIGERHFIHPKSDLVHGDNDDGMRQVVEHLHSLGHTKIVHITSFDGIGAKRREAFEKYMSKLGLEPRVFGYGQPATEIGGYLVAKDLIQNGEEFTAIATENDAQAAGVWAVLKENGIRVPEDVSLIGYDNSPITSDYFLKMTTIDENGIQIGREAARILLERMNRDSKKALKTVTIPPTLIVRETTAKAKAAPKKKSSRV